MRPGSAVRLGGTDRGRAGNLPQRDAGPLEVRRVEDGPGLPQRVLDDQGIAPPLSLS